jgi:hypothetical protein
MAWNTEMDKWKQGWNREMEKWGNGRMAWNREIINGVEQRNGG